MTENTNKELDDFLSVRDGASPTPKPMGRILSYAFNEWSKIHDLGDATKVIGFIAKAYAVIEPILSTGGQAGMGEAHTGYEDKLEAVAPVVLKRAEWDSPDRATIQQAAKDKALKTLQELVEDRLDIPDGWPAVEQQ